MCRVGNKVCSRTGFYHFLIFLTVQGGDLQLVHKACQCGIEVSTLDLLLDILDQVGDNHITNSKDEVCIGLSVGQTPRPSTAYVYWLFFIQYGRTPLHEACAGLKPRSADIEEKDALVSLPRL